MPSLLAPRHRMFHCHRWQRLGVLDVENKLEVGRQQVLSLRHQRRHAIVDVVGRHRRRRRIAESPRLQRHVWTSPPQRHHHPHTGIVPNALVLLLGRAPRARLALQRRGREHKPVRTLQHLHRQLPRPLPAWPHRRLAPLSLQLSSLPLPNSLQRQGAFPVFPDRWPQVLEYQRDIRRVSLTCRGVELHAPRRPLKRHIPNRNQQRLLVHRSVRPHPDLRERDCRCPHSVVHEATVEVAIAACDILFRQQSLQAAVVEVVQRLAFQCILEPWAPIVIHGVHGYSKPS
mmetsp:Transcript_16177/g.38777  ORF Transcript_16177/g.38777 Transcript_16177/m.38777 type:complete len:287 (+) Transcript_16177:130-990(+)